MNPAHLDYETLADLAEGMLDDEHAASASEHLEHCAACQERSADLTDVTRILAEAPIPPMPSELAARIDAAISAEALTSATVLSMERRRGRRRLRMLSVAAAAVVVVGGGAAVGKSLIDNTLLNSDSPQANSGKAADADRTRIDSDSDSGSGSESGPATAPAAPSGPAAPGASGESGAAGQPRRQSGSYVQSGTDYRAATLDQQVKQVISSSAGKSQQFSARSDGAAATPLEQCVSTVTQGRTPALVDSARYEGRTATVIAVPTNARGFDVWIVGPRCSPQDPDLIKQSRVAG